MKVDLSEQPFNSVGITFAGKHYKLFHGDDNDNVSLQAAFPQYFERTNTIQPDRESIPVNNEPLVIEDLHSDEADDADDIPLNEVKPYDYPNIEDTVYEIIDLDTVIASTVDLDIDLMEPKKPEKPEPRVLSKDEIDDLLSICEDDFVPFKDADTLEPEVSKFESTIKTVIETTSRVVSGTLDFVMSLRFIVMVSMLMIAASAISFDIDGWKETYHRLDPSQVTFIIVSLYVAKMAIIKILSVGVDKEKIGKIWQDKIAFYFNHYMLRMVLVASLVGMVFVSSVGIYSSLAVSTVGDAKTISMGDSRIKFIDKQILTANSRILTVKNTIPEVEKNIQLQLSALDSSISSIRDKITNTKVRISDLPKNYKTMKRNLQIQINRMNDEISKVQEKKTIIISSKAGKVELINKKVEVLQDKITSLEDTKEQAKIELNEKQVGETNKALNFTAELLGIELLALLKMINLLMTFVLEITYLALTWLVVRIDSYAIRKEEYK